MILNSHDDKDKLLFTGEVGVIVTSKMLAHCYIINQRKKNWQLQASDGYQTSCGAKLKWKLDDEKLK